jgi:DNA (cytosine-5)-methyltransferase 1
MPTATPDSRLGRNRDQVSTTSTAPLRVVSFFSGAGGLDLGFEAAGFTVPWANEYDRTIWETYELNFRGTTLDRRSIASVERQDLPAAFEGIVGGPPCQSWSEAGALRGIDDRRGQLFFEYVRLLETTRPLFFLAENVSGILFGRHSEAFKSILGSFTSIGYNVTYCILKASDYGVPQDRERVFIVGYRTDLGKWFAPPSPETRRLALKDAIYDLQASAAPAGTRIQLGSEGSNVPNHEYLTGGFSSIYMSRNRVRAWDEPSFTIPAGGRHAPLHPQAPKMILIDKDKRIFVPGQEYLYRRLTVRECARVQTFPDDHIFVYDNVVNGYKMVGNAVPVELARRLAMQIQADIVKCSAAPPNWDIGSMGPLLQGQSRPVSSGSCVLEA